MTGPPLLLAVVVALGLVVWAVFYMLGMPLNPAEAVVVVGLCGALAYGVRAAALHWLARRRHKAAGTPAHHGPPGHGSHGTHAAGARPKAKAGGGKPRKKRH